jgi:ABC-type phosphate transport system auxiliary subunit
LGGGLDGSIGAFWSWVTGAIASVAVGFVLGIILILLGMSRMGEANKILKATEKREEAGNLALNQPEHAERATLPPAPVTEELKRTMPARPPSIVENTTMKLKQPE